jgi:hypothetical protein
MQEQLREKKPEQYPELGQFQTSIDFYCQFIDGVFQGY